MLTLVFSSFFVMTSLDEFARSHLTLIDYQDPVTNSAAAATWEANPFFLFLQPFHAAKDD